MLPEQSELKPLPPPYELIDWRDGMVVDLPVVNWTIGLAPVTPRDGREPKTVVAVRVFLAPGAKPTEPPYYDLTSQHLAASLYGRLMASRPPFPRLRVRWLGTGPKGRPQIETLG